MEPFLSLFVMVLDHWLEIGVLYLQLLPELLGQLSTPKVCN